MGDCRLTPRARRDLERIWEEGAARWGEAQADRYIDALAELFGLIADFPQMARLREEIKPPVRLHPHGAHLVVYTEAGGVTVLRVLHGRQDLLAALDG